MIMAKNNDASSLEIGKLQLDIRHSEQIVRGAMMKAETSPVIFRDDAGRAETVWQM
jgi:hypothetical protein